MATQVPYTGAPSVEPQQNATPYEHIDAPLAAFGGATAAATEHLGRVGEQASNELYSRAMALQQLNQSAEAAEAVASFTTAMGEKYANYRSLEGKAAVDGYQPYIKDLNETREQVGANLSSDYARKLYLQESRSIQARSVFSAAAHAGDQNKKYIQGTQTAVTNSYIDASANDPMNEASYNAALKNIDSGRDMTQTMHGFSPEQTDEYIRNQKSDLIFKRATAMALTKPQAAQDFLDKSMKDGLITSDQAGKASRYIRQQNLSVQTRVESASLMSGETSHWGEEKVSPDRLLGAVRNVESSDNYQQVHPDVTHKVNGQTITEHGLGAYGILQSNLQPWLKEAGMPAMSEQEFLNNRKAQDDLAKFKLTQYQEKYGSANEALKHWRGMGGADLASGESEAEYLKKGNRALAKNASGSDVDRVSRSVASKLAPDDEEFADTFTQRNISLHRQTMQIEREDRSRSLDVVNDAMAPGPDGKLPTTLNLSDPKVADAWGKLTKTDKAKFNAILIQNATGGYAETPENQAMYRKYLGQIGDPRKDAEDHDNIWKLDPQTLPLPQSQRDDLIKLQKNAIKASTADPIMNRVISELGPTMDKIGLDKKNNKDEYYTFMGTMKILVKQRAEDTGKPVTPDDIKAIGTRLMQETKYPGAIWGNTWPSSAVPTKLPVPEKDRAMIVKDLQVENPGLNPSEAQIHQIYAARKYNELYGKKATSPAVPGASK